MRYALPFKSFVMESQIALELKRTFQLIRIIPITTDWNINTEFDIRTVTVDEITESAGDGFV